MDSIRLNSVTFYQSVLLNSKGENTVHKSLRGQENTQCAFMDDKIFIRNKDWLKGSKDKIVIVGLHNVRAFNVNIEDFLESEYKDVFKCFKAETNSDNTVTLSEPPIVGTLPEKEDVQSDLASLGIEFDKRWGVQKLVELKDNYLQAQA